MVDSLNILHPVTWTFDCIVKRILIKDGLAGERLQDNWSSGSLEKYEAKHFTV